MYWLLSKANLLIWVGFFFTQTVKTPSPPAYNHPSDFSENTICVLSDKAGSDVTFQSFLQGRRGAEPPPPPPSRQKIGKTSAWILLLGSKVPQWQCVNNEKGMWNRLRLVRWRGEDVWFTATLCSFCSQNGNCNGKWPSNYCRLSHLKCWQCENTVKTTELGALIVHAAWLTLIIGVRCGSNCEFWSQRRRHGIALSCFFWIP